MSIAARRAVFRWSWRLFRREWRQQVLVLLLLTTTVAVAVYGAMAARSLTPSAAGEFGSASHVLHVSARYPAELDATLAAMATWFGTVDFVGSRQVSVPGSVGSLDYRSQDPTGPYTAPMLALRAGRYPTGDEVAITSGVAADQHVAVGDHLDSDGTRRAIVGLVENPADLGDEFVLVAPNDPEATEHNAFVRTSDDLVRGLPSSVHLDGVMVRGHDESTVAAIAALSVALVVAILVCLVAAAGFVVIAQRRLRQLGMLAAIGATERNLRLVVMANGFVVGAVSALTGATIACMAWLMTSTSLEGAAGHRLDRYDVAWWIVLAGMTLALLTAVTAAWWPGRTVSRVPITMALSARPPRPRPVHRSAVLAVALVILGVAGLAVGIDNRTEEANALLVLPGVAALVGGVLLLSPLAIRALAPLGHRAPIAVRLALRDIVRYQARSSVALAAITLSLGLAVTTVIVAGAAQDGAGSGNLSDRQVLIRIGTSEPVIPDLSDEALANGQAEVDRLVARLHATVVPLSEAITPGMLETRDGVVYQPVVVLGRPIGGNGLRDIDRLYVATPEVADLLRLDLSEVGPGVDLLTPQTGDLAYANTPPIKGGDGMDPLISPSAIEAIDGSPYSSVPSSLLTPAAIERRGWEVVPAAWLLEAPGPLTVAQVTQARDAAARAGLTIEVRDWQQGIADLRTWATVVGMALALAILAMTVGLMRGEATGELRTLVATGAASGTRRAIVAATAGSLALLGVTVGIAGAYLALIASYHDILDRLSNVPVVNLGAIALGVPALASAAGWLLAGREPPTRIAIE